MKIKSFDGFVDTILIESDIRLKLTVGVAPLGASFRFDCTYPENCVKLSEEVSDGTLRVKVQKNKLLIPRFQICDLTLWIASELRELRVDAASAEIHFQQGHINDCLCNLAEGVIQVDRGFGFATGHINSGRAQVTIHVPACFDDLAINLAAGDVALSLPASEYIGCTRKGILTSTSDVYGTTPTAGPPEKHISVNGSAVSCTVTSYREDSL